MEALAQNTVYVIDRIIGANYPAILAGHIFPKLEQSAHQRTARRQRRYDHNAVPSFRMVGYDSLISWNQLLPKCPFSFRLQHLTRTIGHG